MCEQSSLNGVSHVARQYIWSRRELLSKLQPLHRVPRHYGAGTGPTGRVADFQGTETYVHYFGEW